MWDALSSPRECPGGILCRHLHFSQKRPLLVSGASSSQQSLQRQRDGGGILGGGRRQPALEM